MSFYELQNLFLITLYTGWCRNFLKSSSHHVFCMSFVVTYQWQNLMKLRNFDFKLMLVLSEKEHLRSISGNVAWIKLRYTAHQTEVTQYNNFLAVLNFNYFKIFAWKLRHVIPINLCRFFYILTLNFVLENANFISLQREIKA